MNIRDRVKTGVSYTVAFLLLVGLFSSGAVFLFRQPPPDFLLFGKVLEGALLIFLLAIFLKNRVVRPSSFYLHLQFILITIPMAVLYVTVEYSAVFYYSSIAGLVVIIATVKYLREFPVLFWIDARKPKILLLIQALMVLFTLSLLGFGLGKNFNLDIYLVYENRRTAATSLPSIYNYLFPWVTKVICPLGLVLAIEGRKKRTVIFLVFVNTVIYSLTHNKLTLFTPFFILGLYFLLGRRLTALRFANTYCIGVICLMCASILGASALVSLAARRALFVPSHLNYIYHDYFSHHGFFLWGNGGRGAELRNGRFLIGEDYFGREEMSANTGWIGAGYMNSGYFGVILYAVLIGLMLRALDSLSSRRRFRQVIALSLLPMISMVTSSDLPTAILTHGGGFAFLLLHIKWIERVPKPSEIRS